MRRSRTLLGVPVISMVRFQIHGTVTVAVTVWISFGLCADCDSNAEKAGAGDGSVSGEGYWYVTFMSVDTFAEFHDYFIKLFILYNSIK